MSVLLGIVLIGALVALTHIVRRRWPAPVAWSSEDELVAMEVARTLGVELEEARLAVLAWR